MVNSGSSALYLAVELLGLEPGDEIITSAVTFSTDIAPMVRAGLVPVFVDVTPDTYQIDVDQIEGAIGPRTKAILAPNLIGNCPDWDRIRAIADAHGLAGGRGLVRLPRRHVARHADRHPQRHPRHELRARRTSSPRPAPAACCAPTTTRSLDRALLLRRWGRRSEVKFFGSQKGDKRFFSDLDGLEYDDLFIFDEVGWNFEPSEISAAFGVVQMRKLPPTSRAASATSSCSPSASRRRPDVFVLPRTTPDIETGWHMFPIMIRPESGVRRADVPAAHGSGGRRHPHGVDGQRHAPARVPGRRRTGSRRAASPNADRVMETGLILPCNHAIDDDGIDYIGDTVDVFFERK